MPLRNLILFFVILATFAGSSSAQVTVSQSFVDDANAAFREVVVLREAVGALKTANEALAKANASNAAAVTAQQETISLLKADNADLRKLKCDSTTFLVFLIKIKRCK